MSESKDVSVSVDDFDEEIRRSVRGLTFSKPIERLFVAEYVANRARMVPLWASLGTVMYLAALLGDFSMIPAHSSIVSTLRLTVFLPYAVLVVVIMKWRPSAANYDALSLGCGLLAVALPMVTFVFARGDHLFVYQTGTLGTLAFFVIVLRPRFLTVLVGVVLMVAIQLLTTKLNGSFDEVTYSGIVSFYVTLAVFLLLSAYFGEHTDRQNFLNRHRGQALHEQLKKLSETDSMTGLSNRHVLTHFRNSHWGQAGPRRTVSAIMLDIDDFKLFNDIYGHLKGDYCIREVSQCISSVVGGKGTVFRYGGEEILVLLPDVNKLKAEELAAEIRKSIEGLGIPHRVSSYGIVTASLGVSTVVTDSFSMEDLLSQTDTALYEAKKAGRNVVRTWQDKNYPAQPLHS